MKAAEATAAPALKAPRYGFIDMLRGVALVVMIETHVVTAYLVPAQRHGWFYFWLTFVNGLVAPTFLFASGFSIILQGRKHWEDWLYFRAPFWRQMRRLGFIILIAYGIHLQHWKLSEYLAASNVSVWRRTLQVDILQCIVASLLFVHLLILIARKREKYVVLAAMVAGAAALATPWIWARDFTGRMPLGLAMYINPHDVSLFPLFPWMVFILSGTVVAVLFLKFVAEGNEVRLMLRMVPIALILILVGLTGRLVPFSLPGAVNFYTTSPLYVMIRLGCVLFLSIFLFLLEKFLRFVPQPLQIAGQESLLVYGMHLWAIYGLLRTRPVGAVLGKEAGYLGCLLLSLGLIFSHLWLARQWQDLKRAFPRHVKWGQVLVVVSLVVSILLR